MQVFGNARWTFRLRVSSTARTALMVEWDRSRWIWNECVAKSKRVHARNRTRPEGADKRTCGPAQLDTMLTEVRTRTKTTMARKAADAAIGATRQALRDAHPGWSQPGWC